MNLLFAYMCKKAVLLEVGAIAKVLHIILSCGWTWMRFSPLTKLLFLLRNCANCTDMSFLIWREKQQQQQQQGEITMADKPSRGLVLYGDGLIRYITPSHTHLHELASRGCCGFLSLPHPPASESEDERVVREFAQLLDACESYTLRSGKQFSTSECLGKSSVPSVAERFMGLKAAIFTNDSSVRAFAEFLGFTALQFDELIMNNQTLKESSASGLLKLLGFQGGKALESCDFDLVFVHIGSSGGCNEAELINGLVGGILQIAQLRSEISSRLHFSVIMSYGTLPRDDDSLLNFSLQEKTHPNVSLLHPRQSYTITGKASAGNIRHHCPMVIAQWQDAVTRKDMAEKFSFEEVKEHGANLAIPADRFLHELAFKLWKAPKYGA